MRRVLLLLLLLAACDPGDDDDSVEPVQDDDDAADDDDATLGPCEPALSITPSTASVLPLDLVVFDGDGGTGDYLWTLESDSGALLNERTGAYLAGQEAGVTDTVVLTDAGCDGSASATVEVLRPLEVLPADVTLPPNSTLTWAVQFGSGEYACTLAADGSSAAITEGCDYTAGNRAGTDLIRVEDLVTGEFLLREVTIDPAATFGHSPEWLALPVGADFQLFLTGGTGHVDVVSDPPGVVTGDASVVTGLAPGRAQVDVVDSFTGQTTSLTIDVLGDLVVERTPWGNTNQLPGHAISGDFDGDGWLDVAISNPAASIGGFQSGGVWIYAGSATGVEPDPVQVISGADRDEAGFGLDVADVDGDGELDLLIGAEENDQSAGNAGAVFVHAGVAGGFFDPEPRTEFFGPRSNIRFGRSVAACDFDGDGWLDVAVGAHDDENQTALDTQSNQGSVYVFLGSADGFDPIPNQTLWGRTFDGSAWVDHADQRLGLSLVAGDVDGDGRCDLASGTHEHDGEANGNQGIVVVFHGEEGGVSPNPWRAITSTAEEPAGAELGRALAVGDADGDGLADLLIGAPNQAVPDAESGQRHGRAHLFLGVDLTALTDSIIDPSAASWSFDGDGGFNETGLGVALQDIDGDGIDDVLVGAPQDEVPDGVNAVGTVAAVLGVAGGAPGAEPLFVWPGEVEGEWAGTWLAAVDDLDGDGLGEVAAYAHRSHRHGIEVGHTVVISTADGARAELEQPVSASNTDFGADFAFLPDHDGDGNDELLVGEDEAPLPDEQRGSGRIHVYDDLGGEPVASPAGWAEHDAGDRLGRGVSAAGDFNGDGLPDFAAISHDDHHPGTFDPAEAFLNPDECPGGFSDRGSVAVFLGVETGWPTEPSFLLYGPQTNQSLHRLAAADVDGDGLSDLIFTGVNWDADGGNDAGGFGVLFGRAHPGGGIQVVCEEPWRYVGLNQNDNLGMAVAAVGDLNGDGCDEFAVGAQQDDLTNNNEGSVRLMHGWGPGCEHAAPHVVTLVGGQSNANLGRGLAGGADVDADGLPDLAVAADNYTVGGAQTGRVWMLPGEYLSSLPVEPLVDQEEPLAVWPVEPDEGRWHVDGQTDEEDLGRGLALIPNLNPPHGGLLVGSPGGSRSGVANTGGARVHEYDPDQDGVGGMDPLPLLVVGGESWNIGSRLGDRAAVGTIGGVPWIAIGSVDCDGSGADGGCVYAMALDR